MGRASLTLPAHYDRGGLAQADGRAEPSIPACQLGWAG